jgi:hypothetical protein
LSACWARAAFNIAAYTLMPFGYKAYLATNILAAKTSAPARLYGPEKPLFDKTWKLPDIEKVTAQ